MNATDKINGELFAGIHRLHVNVYFIWSIGFQNNPLRWMFLIIHPTHTQTSHIFLEKKVSRKKSRFRTWLILKKKGGPNLAKLAASV